MRAPWRFVALFTAACGTPHAAPAESASTEAPASEAAASDAVPCHDPAPPAGASGAEPAESAPKARRAASDAAWRPFSYAPGVTVDMPGKPADAGVAGVFALQRGEGRGLSVQCSEGGTAKERAETLAGMKRGVIGDRKLVSEKKVTRGHATGVRLDIVTETTAGATHLRVLLLAGEKHVCSFTSIVSGAAPDADSDRFLDSANVD